MIRISVCFKKFSSLNPKTESFGIYLYHSVVVFITGILLKKIVGSNNFGFSSSILYSVIWFGVAYTTTTIVVKKILGYQFFYLQKGEIKKTFIPKVYKTSFNLYNRLKKAG
jgi:hypothetical protein